MFHYPSFGRNFNTQCDQKVSVHFMITTQSSGAQTFWSFCILVAWLRRGGLFRSIFFVLTYFSVLRSNERPKHVVGSNKLHVKKCCDFVDWLVSGHPFSETSSVIISMWILISSKMGKFNEEIMHLCSGELPKMTLHERTLKIICRYHCRA
jgi:hypothetical protein